MGQIEKLESLSYTWLLFYAFLLTLFSWL